MRAGRVVATTTTAPRRTSRSSRRRWSAKSVEAGANRAAAAQPARRCFGARAWSAVDASEFVRLGPVDLDIFRGEIVGIAGVGGNGQDELVACVIRSRHTRGRARSRSLGGPDRMPPRCAFRAAGSRLYQRRSRRGRALPDRLDPRQFHRGRERDLPFSRFGLRSAAIIDAEAAAGARAAFALRYRTSQRPGRQPLRRQSAAPRHRARTRARAETARRRAADARRRHCRIAFIHGQIAAFRDRRRRGPADLRIARRDPCASPTASSASTTDASSASCRRAEASVERSAHDARPEGGMTGGALAWCGSARAAGSRRAFRRWRC